MRKLTAILLMFAFAQLFSVPPVHAQQVVYARFIPSGSALPTIFNASCQAIGGSGGGTSTAIDTTGAKAIVLLEAGYNPTNTITDSKSNGSAVRIGGATGGGAYSEIFYYPLPTTGTGHTFTTNDPYSNLCILPISNINGSFDTGTFSSANVGSGTTCQAGSITPPSGNHIVVAGLGTNGGTSYSINLSFTLDGQIAFSPNFGVAAAHLVQTPNGSATNPTWTVNATVGLGCVIASFN